MPEEMRFFIFLIEQYAKKRSVRADVLLKEWDEKQITEKIYDSYEMYHQEGLENAYQDIDSLMKTGEYAW